MDRVATVLGRLWIASPPLTAVALLMTGAAFATAIGILVDPRVITGAPAWLKPFKFAVSTTIYSLTLAWIFTYLTDWPRVRRVVGWTTAVVFVLEVAIISLQAWRGTTSHFNASTPFDLTLYMIMGSAIVVQTLMSISVAVALWRHRFADRPLGWALRIGMVLTIVGASTGGLMTRPTPEQLADAQAGRGMPIAGAHTVGAPDGGPGIPVTGWSREHGDLRVPHFIGLHAIQVLALVAVALRRWDRSAATRVRAMIVAGASYGLFFLLVLFDALRGRGVLAPDGTTLAAMAVWLFGTAIALASIDLASRAALKRRTA